MAYLAYLTVAQSRVADQRNRESLWLLHSVAVHGYRYQGAVYATTYSKGFAVLDMTAKTWTLCCTTTDVHTLAHAYTQRDDIYVGHEYNSCPLTPHCKA